VRPRNDKPISEQAVEWIEALQRGGAQEHAAFAAWLRESPHHVREYLLMTALEKELGDMDLSDVDVEELISRSRENVVPLPSLATRESSSKRTHGARWRGAGAAALVLVALGAFWIYQAGGPAQYSTAIGEERTVELADGSLAQLGPGSEILVRMSELRRDVQLIEGDAIFKVSHDETRPFRVRSGETLIEDLGTQFHVYRRGSATVVTVIEGAVRIASMRLDAGQEARITRDGTTLERRPIAVTQTTLLRRRHLTFSGDTLADIAADFNRYNRAPQISVEGGALRARRYSGGFEANDPQSLIDYLQQDDTIISERRGDELILRER
jgi:transmembrane sensor